MLQLFKENTIKIRKVSALQVLNEFNALIFSIRILLNSEGIPKHIV